jgi:predicted transcriptional regulator
MASSILRATKLNPQLPVAAVAYGNETELAKLGQNSGWGFTKGSKRGRLEIMAEILCYCGQQKAKTDIMYKINLNYAQLKRHLKALTSQGLLVTNKNKYATTRKGYRFLKLFVQLNNILSS